MPVKTTEKLAFIYLNSMLIDDDQKDCVSAENIF